MARSNRLLAQASTTTRIGAQTPAGFFLVAFHSSESNRGSGSFLWIPHIRLEKGRESQKEMPELFAWFEMGGKHGPIEHQAPRPPDTPPAKHPRTTSGLLPHRPRFGSSMPTCGQISLFPHGTAYPVLRSSRTPMRGPSSTAGVVQIHEPPGGRVPTQWTHTLTPLTPGVPPARCPSRYRIEPCRIRGTVISVPARS